DFQIRYVDVRRPDILAQLYGCDGFMWRWAHFDGMGRIARRLIPVIEDQLGIPVYPDRDTCWHYDDKIAQAYLLKSLGVPMPQTWIWFDRTSAHGWADQAKYPLVLKLATGAGSNNVKLMSSAASAHMWIDRLFDFLCCNLDEEQFLPMSLSRSLRQ